MSKIRNRRLLVACASVVAAWVIVGIFAPAWSVRILRAILAPFGIAFQLTTILFSVLPVLGLAWFVWHLLIKRRVRLRRLRRVRVRQGRTTNLLAPPPVFGAAYKKANHAIDRDRTD